MKSLIAALLRDNICKGEKYRFVNINPGFVDGYGHHLILNQKLKKTKILMLK